MKKGLNQIFYTTNSARWKIFKWSFRLLFIFLLVTIISITLAIQSSFTPKLPKLQSKNFKKILISDENPDSLVKEYKGFKNFIFNKRNEINLKPNRNSNFFNPKIGIRSAFYVDWDPQGYFSLKRNIKKLNLIIPEWLFLDSKGDSLLIQIEKRGYKLIKKTKGLKVMPMLTNYINGKWDGIALSRILNSNKKSKKLITDLYKWIKSEGFAGVNIDFEELLDNDDRKLTDFFKKLSERFHKGGLLTSIDVMPFNDNYNYKTLSEYSDYIFLMAYDQYTNNSKPGPISSQKWIEGAVDQISKKVPTKKIILCIAGFGYDWPKGGEGSDVTYQQALSIAKKYNCKITYDTITYNLNFKYKDKIGFDREVHFTDAATNFNTIRFAKEYGLAGTSLWRMGSEDRRLWKFYNLPMNKASIKNFNFKKFSFVETTNDVDFMGEGEVLDVISTPSKGIIRTKLDPKCMLISDQIYEKLPSMFVVKQFGKSTQKKMVLTFDDGPHSIYTNQILDILDHYKVIANFFIIGIEAEKNIPTLKRIYESGHEISNHTFTHPNMAKVSKQRAFLEMDATKLLIEAVTGRSTIMFRAPFNADSRPETMEELAPVAISRENNYLTINENIDPLDWQLDVDKRFNGDSIFNRVVRMKDKGNIILLHDSGGDRSATVEALPKIIEYFHEKGYTFTTVADLIGKTRNDVMPLVPNYKKNYLLKFNRFLAEIGYYLSKILKISLIFYLILGSIRLILILLFSILDNKKIKKQKLSPLKNYPLVSIVVPAFNEEINIVSSLNNLLLCDYKHFNVIFVNDGSNDNTLEIVRESFNHNKQITILDKINGGKASALNLGIKSSTADYIVCIDADTKLKSDAISKMMMHFNNPDVGAVAGNVKVGNKVNILTYWQNIEYIISQNIDRKAFGYINSITIVPGAIGAYRKNAINIAGGFTSDTLSEDCDLTMRLLKCGFKIKNEGNAIAYTEAPESLKQFMLQRFRWTFGVLQTFWKNKDALFNINFPKLGFIALPDILLFKFIIPILSPFADTLMILGLITGNTSEIGLYYSIFLGIDILLAIIAFTLEKESYKTILWLIPQRIIYRWLILIILFKTFRKAFKGELQYWGILKRTGNVKQEFIRT